MSHFHLGFADELIKVALGQEALAAMLAPGLAREAGGSAGREAVREAVKKVKPYKKEIAGAGVGALAGRALMGKGRGALGALLGLGVARHKDVRKAVGKTKDKLVSVSTKKKGAQT